ncbi:TraM recognition domain-containing protein [Capnocytophaga canis]|uniref:TraD/TraG TraM recognition site domain-containing protein n=1 Tax=Capnocytophaga canis TaxID=1848903 RepID=A0A0B7ILH4_9FLAO|nr:type IV secretory system conjugative DNA transfer family protein [Capnocytophaga canis]CEN52726.1 conserved membrane hypothetical protein [Capnocytophaga canis]
MIGTYENKEEYRKISYLLTFFALCVFGVYTYVYYFPFFEKNGLANEYTLKMAHLLFNTIPNSLLIKIIIILFSATAIMTFSSKQAISEEKKRYMGHIGFTAFALFVTLMVIEQFFRVPGGIALTLHCLTYIIYLFCLLMWRKQIVKDLKKDRRQLTESQFDQSRELIETPNSVNIKYTYSYLGEQHFSFMNILQPYRGSLVGGVPGSGKSFAIIEEYMRQMIRKSFTGVVYDFKFPTLSLKTYNYFLWYQHFYKVKPSFYVVNFDDPEYSHRCNPIGVDNLETITDAEENTKVLMLNINKTWLEKEGDFFTDSANVFAAMLLWYLKLVTKKYKYNVCSFPHLVKLAAFPSSELLFFILLKYSELKAKMKSFVEAMDKEASEQLAGQVASATTALAKVSNKELDYIMSGDDFTFDLNDPLAPKILCVGNNPDRQIVYSPSIGLILTKLSKVLNKQKMEPSMFCIDEFPTVYIRGIDNLIATGRSNKIAPILGFQTFAQIIADYGEETAQKIIKDCGNRIAGQLFDDDAEKMSKTIGRQKNLSVSYNYSSDEVSENQQVQMEDIVPPERIAQFSQGTFCGVIADEFKNKNENKIFYGDVLPDVELKKYEEDIPMPKIREFITKEEKTKKTQEYQQKHKKDIQKFVEVFAGQHKNYWINILENVSTEQGFNDFLVRNFDLEEDFINEFTDLIQFKNQFKGWVKKSLKKVDDKEAWLNTAIEIEVLKKNITQWLEEGFSFKAKNDFLEAHSKSLEEDIYRIVALEMKDLGIVDTFKNSEDSYYRKHKRTAKRIFTNIVNDFSFTDKYTKEMYEFMIEEFEE